MFGAVRQSMVSWLGIFGGAMTLLSNLQGILDLAKWANWIASSWSQLVEPIVLGAIALLGVRVASDAGMLIAMAVFVAAVAVGARLENSVRMSDAEVWPVSWHNVFNLRVLTALCLYGSQVALVSVALSVPSIYQIYATYPTLYTMFFTGLYVLAIIVGLRGWPISHSVTVAFCLLLFSNVFAYSSTSQGDDPSISYGLSTAIAAGFAVGCGLTIVAVAPPRTFTRRLLFMTIGTAIIVLLSELSKLGIEA